MGVGQAKTIGCCMTEDTNRSIK